MQGLLFQVVRKLSHPPGDSEGNWNLHQDDGDILRLELEGSKQSSEAMVALSSWTLVALQSRKWSHRGPPSRS